MCLNSLKRDGKMRVHYRKQFIKWLDGELSPGKKHKIDRHLRECAHCATYFHKMRQFLESQEEPPLPWLEPLPGELTRIRSLAQDTPGERSESPISLPAKTALVYSLILLFALLSGIWMGKGLVSVEGKNEIYSFVMEQQEILQTSQAGFARVWESFSGEQNHEN